MCFKGEWMKRTFGIMVWAALSGVGIAGILNTILIIASGLGRFNLGNALPALLGGLLLGIGVKKLMRPDRPVFSNSKVRLFFSGTLALAGVWFVVVLLLIGYGWPRTDGETAEWMLVPGAGLRGDQLSLTLMERLDTAAAYWRQHPDVKIMVSGGQGPDELISEAEAMYRYLEQMGIPSTRIHQENQSTSTWENIAFSKTAMDQAGRDSLRPLVIASSRYHLFRAIGIAEAQGVQAVGIPAAVPGSVFIGSYMRETLAVTKFLILGH